MSIIFGATDDFESATKMSDQPGLADGGQGLLFLYGWRVSAGVWPNVTPLARCASRLPMAAMQPGFTTGNFRIGRYSFEIRGSFVPHWPSLSSKHFQFFRVTVRDRDGANHSAWMRMESDCTEPEVLDVIWDDKRPRA